ncbi:hypothetical protein [Agrococcus sp. ARC_14]|uniref:hypothetical protein n=1 Tax=Agrococcus sp. ARC_14 TaxID=2919927 RepID=UPI001F07069D|nr:hypothetical protein [Agrococcus sp. ARC_14]MCH1881820.1 hypothetical protein [Agrococcus sp. ARC_14]
MRYPNHFDENIDHPESREGEQPEQDRHPRGHGRFHRGGGRGFGPGHRGQGFGPGLHREAGFGHDHADHGPRCEQHQAHEGRSDQGHPCHQGYEGRSHWVHEGRSHQGHQAHQAHGRGDGQPGEQPHGGAHRRPTLGRSIMKSARRIRRSGLTPEQLHRRIAATVSHADYMTTMRTLRRIGMELRTERGNTEHGNTERDNTEHGSTDRGTTAPGHPER